MQQSIIAHGHFKYPIHKQPISAFAIIIMILIIIILTLKTPKILNPKQY
jgi:uncharacterized membrane protein YvbJ